MLVTVNGEKKDIADGASLAALIEHLDMANATRGIAVAVNSEVVPHENWKDAKLQDGDTVEIIRAVQGG